MSLLNYLGGYKNNHIKKVLFDVLQEKYNNNEQIIERVNVSLLTDMDMHQFVKLINDVYCCGYSKAVNDHKEQLEKLGLKSRIVQSNDG